ncbi:TOMM system kinase/cyclase fusion protein [Sorangium sp. So ce448]|uniref:TOMM system kinase/cyclase fusion protein n=1 Tax=Sorangium sp. So ce448 TaxID=3133314 RepID=UPI003F625228
MQCYAADGAALAPGATFDGRYEILAKLGEGGFGVVHKARQLTTGQPIALKILRLAEQGGAAQADRRTARFLRETRLCAQLHHPNIVQLVDAGQAGDGTLYAAFAFAPGDNLAALLQREGALAPSEARHLMLQALDALACAHAAGVVHRDLKPSNIMVIPTGARRNALVLDFGIGATLDDGRSARLTGSHDALGTPGYGAPEQWRGAEASPRADLFSWGLVFLECLTGKPAYGGTEAEIFYRLLGPDPVPIPAALEHHPLGDLLARALRKDEGARDVTARGLFEALEACTLRGLSREVMLGAGGRPAGGDTRSLSSIARVATSLDRRREPAPPALDGERRQLTALCCHVRARAAVAQALDAVDVERLDDPLRAALARCADLGRRHGGYVAAAFGDDLLVYFGYPSAAEDDARRAARAALAMAGAEDAEDPRSAAPGARIDVSVGLHTGLVVDGNLGDLDGACLVTGATPRLAARLAALAPPGSVAASAASQALLRASFDLESEGGRAIEGIAAPVETYRLRQEHGAAASWPTPDGSKAPLSGRDQETGLLVERWRRACEGAGQSILITGEPGIGKSRLARALRDRLAREAHTFLEARCSPDTQTSPLRPVVDLLERTLGLDQEPDAGGKIARIERELAGHGFTLAEAMPLFVPLFSLPLGEPYAPLDVSPQRHKALTLQAVASLLLAIADERPVLLVAEDLHWADPTTMEFLAQLVREAPAAPLCVIMTARPEFSPSFSTADMLLLPLSRLERPHMEEMLTGLSGHKALPPAVIEQVADRADGVPLFAEELLRMMIDARLLVEREDRYELTRPLSGAAIPGTLRALLTARLDRLSRAKQTAQLAAAMGREFSVKVLSAASPLGPAAVAEDLERLMSAGIVLRRRRGKEAVGSFKHALVRDAAYESLSTGARQRSHARIAKTLEEGFPEVVRTRPDLLAHHHAAAEQMREAVGYAQEAAQAALARSAYVEAITGAKQAIAWLPAIAQEHERAEMELGLNGIIMPALITTKGWSAPEVKSIYDRAIELATQTGERERGSQALHGMAMFTLFRGDLTAARDIATQCAKLAEDTNDVVALTQASLILANVTTWLGDHTEGERHHRRVIELYQPAELPLYMARYGWNPSIVVRVTHAMSACICGEPDGAVRIYEEAIAAAEATEHPFTIAIAYQIGAWIHHLRREVADTQRYADALGKVAAEHGFPAFVVLADALGGWAMVHSGQAEQGLERVRGAIARWRRMGSGMVTTFYATHLADACLAAGAVEGAREAIDEALGETFTTQERCYHPELHRLLGEVWRARGDPGQAAAAFASARDMAEAQRARLFALRAQVALVRLRRAEGRVELDDVERLRRLRSGITDIPDAREADSLLFAGAGQPSTGESSRGSGQQPT